MTRHDPKVFPLCLRELWGIGCSSALPTLSFRRLRLSLALGDFAYMKALLSILLSASLFSGCSRGHTAYLDETTDVVAGKDIRVGSYVLNVKRREGNSLEGVRIVQRAPDGKETTITADTGTITEGPKRSIESPASNLKNQSRAKIVVIQEPMKVTLFNANVQTTSHTGTVARLEISF